MNKIFKLSQIWESIYSGLIEIYSHKLRSFLTLIGIVFGTCSILIVVSLMNGAKLMIKEIFEQIGSVDRIYIYNKLPSNELEKKLFIKAKKLNKNDVKLIKNLVPNIKEVFPHKSYTYVYKDKYIGLYGTSFNVLTSNYKLIKGYNFLDIANKYHYKVCIITQDTANLYFNKANPVGKYVNIDNNLFLIIGVVKQKSLSKYKSLHTISIEDLSVFIPLSVFDSYIKKIKNFNYLEVVIKDINNYEIIVNDITRILKLAHNNVENFYISDFGKEVYDVYENIQKIIKNWNIILVSLASISLIIGGIGILSIMLIVINERIFEIGLRKSVGATNLEIFIQFLNESITMSSIGGVIGVLLGIVIISKVAKFFPFQLIVSPTGIILDIFFAITIGIVFGYYPAKKASNLSPIEALRF